MKAYAPAARAAIIRCEQSIACAGALRVELLCFFERGDRNAAGLPFQRQPCDVDAYRSREFSGSLTVRCNSRRRPGALRASAGRQTLKRK